MCLLVMGSNLVVKVHLRLGSATSQMQTLYGLVSFYLKKMDYIYLQLTTQQ